MLNCTQLNHQNNELDQRLSEENKAIVIDMIAYLRMAPISDIQVEEIRQDILDMALGAQERQEPLSNVFGVNRKVFCDDIISNMKHQKKSSLILQWLATGCGVFAIFGMIDIVFSGYLIRVFQDIWNHTKIDLSYPITLSFLINSVIIAALSFGIVYFIGKHSFETKNFTRKFDSLTKPKKFIIGCCFGAVLFGYFFCVAKLNAVVLISVNVIVYVILLLLFFSIFKFSSHV